MHRPTDDFLQPKFLRCRGCIDNKLWWCSATCASLVQSLSAPSRNKNHWLSPESGKWKHVCKDLCQDSGRCNFLVYEIFGETTWFTQIFRALYWRSHVGAHPDWPQHGGRKLVKTSVTTEFWKSWRRRRNAGRILAITRTTRMVATKDESNSKILWTTLQQI